MSGELNNCAMYFPPFANVNQTEKITVSGSIGGVEATCQPWDYVAEKVAKFKAKLKDPGGKQRPEVTKFIAKENSKQQFAPPLGKHVDLAKAEPLHNTNNAWQHWFLAVLAVAIQYTGQAKLKTATVVSDLPNSSALVAFQKCTCIRETIKCGRLCNSSNRWFS